MSKMSLEEYLKRVSEIANGYWREGKDGTKTFIKGIPSIRNFINHHAAAGVWNGSVVWKRLPSFYDRGKRYVFKDGKLTKLKRRNA